MTEITTELPEVDAPVVDEAAEVPEGEVPAAAAETPTEPAKPTKHKVPDGWATPIEALHALKQQGLVSQDFPPQRMYGFVKNPGKTDPFPVKHFDAEGVQYDTPQLGPDGINPRTRPGVKTDEVIAWWKGKGDRDKAKAEAKAAKAKAKEEAAAAKAAKAAAAPAQATAEVPADAPAPTGAEDVEAE
jgi:hypothetical protein